MAGQENTITIWKFLNFSFLKFKHRYYAIRIGKDWLMKQDMELIKLILQTLAENENFFMLSDHLAKQIQAITNEKKRF